MHTDPRLFSLIGRPACFIGMLACTAIVACGALVESRDWALTGTITGATGYDSNLTLTRDGPGDMFVQATPKLTFGRRNSGTDLHVDGEIVGTEFVNHRQPAEANFSLGATYAYPFVKNVIPLYKSDFLYQLTSEPDQYLGRRIRHERVVLAGEGYLSLTGKVGLRGAADIYRDDFREPTLSTNSRWRLFAGLAYEKRPGLEASINLGFAEGRSEPNQRNIWGLTVPVRSTETDLTARIRGEITPKISGSAYVGFGHVNYRGAYSNHYNLPVAGADVTWGIDPRRTLVLAAYSGADYAPDGQSVVSTRAFLSYTHVIVGRWQYILRGGPTHTVFRHFATTSTDVTWEGGVEFGYTPSDRFRVSLGLMEAHHDSDMRDRQYNRYTISLNSSYRF